MAVEQIKETDTLNQGSKKINAILDQSNASSEKVDSYKSELEKGIKDSKEIAQEAGQEAISIATEAGKQANITADQALTNSQTAITTAGQAVSTANNNKQEFDTLRNDFDQLVAESGDSNPEIVQARTDTQGVKRPTLATRLQMDFNDRMTKANGLSLFSGNTNVKIMMDFNGKTAGNTTTNPHKYFSDFTAKTLKKPSDTWNEVSQADYNKLASRDDSGVTTGSTQSGVIPQQMGVFDVVETAKKLAPQIYEKLNRTEAATQIKNNFIALTISARAKATSPNNKNLKVSTFVQSTNSWTSQIQETASELNDFTVQINDKNFITDDGYVYQTSYTDASNGVSSSSLDMDYCGMQLELTVDAQNILTASGFAKQTDIDFAIEENVTKEKIGLGNVKNYDIATQSEAQSGASDAKYMTPLKTVQAVKAMVLNLTYPVGAIYTSINENDPASLFGGIWERYATGKTLIGVDENDPVFNSSGKTGGEKAHTLTVAEMPNHTHAYEVGNGNATTVNRSSGYNNAGSGTQSGDVNTKGAGGGQAHNNLPPYVTTYMWVRTA
ncbi:phage baseplate protein [Enterococcus sp. AZ126]|uniref:phage baseplate protein n=1 Tax=Enterococcus sp. AZ126 TaxID=2774635 RepID=UPI003F1EE456